MPYYQLSKRCLHIENNVDAFLNGITTNTLDAPKNAFVDAKGKIIATCEQQRTGTDGIYLLVEFMVSLQLIPHLETYRALSKSIITPDPRPVFYDLDGDLPADEAAIIFPQAQGKIFVTPQAPASAIAVDDQAFANFRLDNRLPVQGLDYTDEMLLTLDQDADYVSFTKGCFLGQEILARVHHRSRAPKLLTVANENEVQGDLHPSLTSSTLDPVSGNKRGFIFMPNPLPSKKA